MKAIRNENRNQVTKRVFLIGFLLTFLLFTSCSDDTQSGTGSEVATGSIAGEVKKEGKVYATPVDVVLLAKTMDSDSSNSEPVDTVSTDDGAFLFTSLEPGIYDLQIFGDEGEVGLAEDIEVIADSAIQLNIEINIYIEMNFIAYYDVDQMVIQNITLDDGLVLNTSGEEYSLFVEEGDGDVSGQWPINIEVLENGEVGTLKGELSVQEDGGSYVFIEEHSSSLDLISTQFTSNLPENVEEAANKGAFQSIGYSGEYRILKVKQGKSQDYFILVQSNALEHQAIAGDQKKLWVVHLDSAGKVVWNTPLDAGVWAYGLHVGESSSLIVYGSKNKSGFIVVLDSTGEKKWDYMGTAKNRSASFSKATFVGDSVAVVKNYCEGANCLGALYHYQIVLFNETGELVNSYKVPANEGIGVEIGGILWDTTKEVLVYSGSFVEWDELGEWGGAKSFLKYSFFGKSGRFY